MTFEKYFKLESYRNYYIYKIRKKLRSRLVDSYGKLGKIERRIRFKDHELIYQSQNYSEWRRPWNDLTTDGSEIYWIENFIEKDDVVYDVGACIGTFALAIAKIISDKKGKGFVYAFEPESQNFASLNRNIKLNGLSNILAFPVGIGRCLKAERFFVRTFDPGFASHGLFRPESSGKKFKPEFVQGVLEISLDQFVRLEGVKFPNHMKIDVDGFEDNVVENMTEVLKNPELKTVHMELDENISQGKIARIFKSLGYEVAQKREASRNIFNVVFRRNA